MKAARSAMTVSVGPVRPFSAGLDTLLPQPRWSKPWTAMPRLARWEKRLVYRPTWSLKPWTNIRLALGAPAG